MNIAKEVFARKRVRNSKLKAAGFTKAKSSCDHDTGSAKNVNSGASDAGKNAAAEYAYSEQFMDGDLTALITVRADGSVFNAVVDSESGEEYIPMNVEAQTGSYVGKAREEYRGLLERVASKCFDSVEFVSDQANRIAAEIERRFSAPPEHPIKSDDAAVFRNAASDKWFAIDMCIKRGKLDDPHVAGSDSEQTVANACPDANNDANEVPAASKRADPDELIDVLNVKIDPEMLDELLKKPGICRCYHMNKKMWVTITMDDRLSDEEIMELLKRSFELTSGGSAGRRSRSGAAARPDGVRKYWLIPSNPEFFDVAKGFRDSGNDTLAWHHRINVLPGDIVYIYQTEPVASIMFECEVLESFLPRPADWGKYAQSSKYRMTLKLLRAFKKGVYPRSWMNEHGIKKTVRGQRSAPPELVEALAEDE